ncbi:MAG: DsbA family protein [Alphaproteobacteria bacterium]
MMKRLRQFAVAATCLAGIGLASAAPAAAEDYTREEIEQIIHAYLMDHPEVIIEAVRALEARQQAEAQEQQRQTLVTLRPDIVDGPSTMVAGNPDGDITLVEFFDYRCGYCKRVAPSIMTLVEADPGLRLAMMEFPILGEQSVYAARAALASVEQNRYWEMHAALINFRGDFTEETIRAIAVSVGLDDDKLIADMASPEIDAVINRNYELAQALQINGTPAFIIGSQVVPGAISLEALQQLIADERQG